MANKLNFEDELKELNNLNQDDYFYYKEWTYAINKIISETGLKIPLEDTLITKLEHYTNMGCNEIGAYTLNGKEYNVGLPIMDKIENILNQVKNVNIEFKDDLTKEHFKSVSIPLVQELITCIEDNIKTLWIDVGSTTYDLHFEIIDSNNNHTDIYLKLSEDKKDLITAFGVGAFSKVVSPEVLEKLIEAVQKVIILRGE